MGAHDPSGEWAGKRPSDDTASLFFAGGDEWATWLCEQGIPGDFHTLLASAIDDAQKSAVSMKMASLPLPRAGRL
jgi:hypothetical protein